MNLQKVFLHRSHIRHISIQSPTLFRKRGGFDVQKLFKDLEHRRIAIGLLGVSGSRVSQFANAFHFGITQDDGSGLVILLAVFDLLAPRDRDDIVALSERPCDAHLRRGPFVGGGDFLQAVYDIENEGPVLSGEFRELAAPVAEVGRIFLLRARLSVLLSFDIYDRPICHSTYLPVARPRPVGEYTTMLHENKE